LARICIFEQHTREVGSGNQLIRVRIQSGHKAYFSGRGCGAVAQLAMGVCAPTTNSSIVSLDRAGMSATSGDRIAVQWGDSIGSKCAHRCLSIGRCPIAQLAAGVRAPTFDQTVFAAGYAREPGANRARKSLSEKLIDTRY
jgi:hypothetical protein